MTSTGQDEKSQEKRDLSNSSKSANNVSLASSSEVNWVAGLHKRSDLHLARKIFHMATGLIIILIYAFVVDRTTAAILLSALLLMAAGLEYLRMNHPALNQFIMSAFGVLMRKSEANSVSGVAFYIAAALISVAVFPKAIALLSIAYLAFGDPIASVFGILYGDRSIRFSNGKSLIGTLAGIVTCFLLTFVFLFPLNVSWEKLLLIAALGGISGGAAENLPLDIDDNFSIPLVAGFVLWISFLVLNV